MRAALAERIAASPEFAKSLQRPVTVGTEDNEELEEDDSMGEVMYDEIDSSRMLDEEVEALILQKPRHTLMDQTDVESGSDDVHIVGAHMERYTGHEFSSCIATNWWMWDAVSHI